jgi:AraC-like DNA-binding protein
MSRETCSPNDVRADAFQLRNRPACTSGSAEGEQDLDEIADMTTVKDVIRTIMRIASEARPPILVLVAQHFCITPRTLQRRLSDRGTSVRHLLSEVRLELATAQLESLGKVSDVAQAAGFSEPSCFHRAFKRWTGQTPAKFRRARGGEE